ncbi:hypothetical protein PFUGPA_04352 [Plasmodium falciparum Palo Alto/Uganda]|uniref:Rifin n=2 Tax=Plasmodium falciparum TaxID=5833 RepID=W4IYS2_PLAFP|nr:hypothetical protein PFUGPA_04352 [Plasmodium falciparum Palo Alto/Uganda]ETW58107.1 hypothetical protein PFMC_05994 [Plasmodium falciparum CAMP/Malaysia]
MKVHYFNILLFSLPLNILVRSPPKNPSITQKRPTTRLLCECDLYTPNYDNDPQMKAVMQGFDRQTSQRFEEYNERLLENKQKCKEQCDKEIQKIILKDKLEKHMAQQLSTLETKITTDDIPTCVCEKSMADKVEKGCLRCGSILGAAMPELGSVGGSLLYALNTWQTGALLAAEKAAIAKATDLATQAGMQAVSLKIEKVLASFTKEQGFVNLSSIVTPSTFDNGDALVETAKKVIGEACKNKRGNTTPFYNSVINYGGESNIKGFAQAGSDAYQTTLTTETPVLQARYTAAVKTAYGGYQIAIIASIVAIVVIVLIMIIIYLILHYRRKKKMKKKLQYIKLLEE